MLAICSRDSLHCDGIRVIRLSNWRDYLTVLAIEPKNAAVRFGTASSLFKTVRVRR